MAASALAYAQYVANYAIDGMIDFDRKATILHDDHYLTITLPEVLIIKQVKVFTSMVSIFQLTILLVRYQSKLLIGISMMIHTLDTLKFELVKVRVQQKDA